MCTVTIHRDTATLLVTMNRDELYTRAPERPPAVFGEGGPSAQWLAPIDGETGGTWIGVNACGVAACLLNAYLPGDMPLQPPATPATSRGGIVPAVLTQGHGARVLAWLADEFDPSPYGSFQLVVVWPEGGLRRVWSGTEYIETFPCQEEWTLVSSSFWNAAAVLAWRRDAFARWRVAGGERRGYLPSFHLLHVEGQEALTPLMDRPWSCTRSITQVLVDRRNRRNELRYWPRKAGEGVPVEPAVTLDLPLLDPPRSTA